MTNKYWSDFGSVNIMSALLTKMILLYKKKRNLEKHFFTIFIMF